jgi:hypothetical protein
MSGVVASHTITHGTLCDLFGADWLVVCAYDAVVNIGGFKKHLLKGNLGHGWDAVISSK